ncbi:MAG: radical SAM/Cys-rich domain protein [bacterium]|nr:radical SAM/Cys-rich domain protein [bacterium]
MNNFWDREAFQKTTIEIVQINLGNLCNLACKHCHVDASPAGIKNMNAETAQKIVETLLASGIKTVEFTGGEPILNPVFPYFIESLSGNMELILRTNLVAFDLPEYRDMMEFLKLHSVEIIGSLPSPFEKTTNTQRGNGVFERSLNILKKLRERGLFVDLVYNPTGDYLPDDLSQLEKNYRKVLKEKFDIEFNKFISIVNVPIKRFRKQLEKEGTLDSYQQHLKKNFNPATLERVMCRSLISIDYEGYIYDCDFNLATNTRIRGYEDKKFWEINFDNFKPGIVFDDYCYACTVNQGSSCRGALLNAENRTGAGSARFSFDELSTTISDVKSSVQNYYGETLQSSRDLQTNACCTTDALPDYVKNSIKYISDEIVIKYYGCGSPIPLALNGLTTLDVGCGTGRDVYILSQLVGEKGFAHGIDMTKNQVSVAQKYQDEQMEIFGYSQKNVSFIHDYMESINRHFSNESFDLAISNCVINLAENKGTVLEQIYSSLKFGGEFYFSDVYADRRIPESIAKNEILYGECLGGALYYKDFERLARKTGFTDPRIMSREIITISNPEIEALVENITFYSITYRLWKLEGLEDACEDYGHVVIYRGGIPYSPFKFELDNEHTFYKNKPERVCGNTEKMIRETRFGRYFEIIGDYSEHFGLFEDCGISSAKDGAETSKGSCCK